MQISKRLRIITSSGTKLSPGRLMTSRVCFEETTTALVGICGSHAEFTGINQVNWSTCTAVTHSFKQICLLLMQRDHGKQVDHNVEPMLILEFTLCHSGDSLRTVTRYSWLQSTFYIHMYTFSEHKSHFILDWSAGSYTGNKKATNLN